MSDCTCVRGDDGQVRVPRSRCPQHGWAGTPTPAPALTDEQIDADLDDLRDLVANFGPCDRKNKRADLFDRTIAAVVARAKREAAEEIAQSIETMPIAGFNGETLKWLKVAREMCAACARQIGATR